MKRSGPPARNAPIARGDAEKARAWRQRSAERAQQNARDRATAAPKAAPSRAPAAPRAPRAALTRRPAVEEPGKAEAAAAFKVAVCGSIDSRLEAHHACPKRALKRIARSRGLKGPAFWAVVYDPRVGVALHPRDHERHTNRVAVIPRESLPPAAIKAAREYGPEAVVALEAEHPTAIELRQRR